MDARKRKVLQIVIFAVAVAMIVYGVSRGEVAIVFKKAINVCFECIGLG